MYRTSLFFIHLHGNLVTTPVLINTAWTGPWDLTIQKLQSDQYLQVWLNNGETYRDIVPSLFLIFEPPTHCCWFSYLILLLNFLQPLQITSVALSLCGAHMDCPCETLLLRSLAGMSFGFNYKNTRHESCCFIGPGYFYMTGFQTWNGLLVCE